MSDIARTPAGSRLCVLVVGDSSDANVCDAYRTSMFVEPLGHLGVEVRYALPSIRADGVLGSAEVQRQTTEGVDLLVAAAGMADIVVFRRAYASHTLCLDCGFATLDTDTAAGHVRSTRHAVAVGPGLAVRRFFDKLESDAPMASRLAIVYETDDDLLRLDPSNGLNRAFRHERDLIERMIRRADLVTTSTPVLAERLAPLATEVRVVRNAVDPAWYGSPVTVATGAADDGHPLRVVFYGSVGRLRDYDACAPAVDAIARGGAARIWLGAPALAAVVARAAQRFDEVHPYVAGVPAFARQLTALRPAIGLAPLSGTPYDRAKSELHWLEYSMAGAATVATRMPGGGPYGVIRDGIDGFLVGSQAEWRRALQRLAGSEDLRTEVAARARERVETEYDVAHRAIEWAAAYRSAAEHAGRGLDRGPSTAARFAAGPRGGSVPATTNRANRRLRDRTAPLVAVSRGPGIGSPSEIPGPAPIRASPGSSPPPAALSSPATILAAYVAAQAFAGRSPLRLRLGVDGSARNGEGGDITGAAALVTIDTGCDPDVRHDVTFGLPFGDGTVEAIEARHVLDRLGDMAIVLTREAARVLRAGGSLRVVTGDRAAALDRQRRLQVQGVALVGLSARLPAFTTESLVRLISDAGFSGAVGRPAGEGEIAVEATR